MNFRWLIATLVFACILAGLHLYALQHHLYWEYRWFDTPMHLLGGVMVGTFIVGLIGRNHPLLFIAGVIVVALGWEYFEYYFKISTAQPYYYFDTAHDIANDCIGGMIAYLASQKNVWRSA
jgi:hypothetical protein